MVFTKRATGVNRSCCSFLKRATRPIHSHGSFQKSHNSERANSQPLHGDWRTSGREDNDKNCHLSHFHISLTFLFPLSLILICFLISCVTYSLMPLILFCHLSLILLCHLSLTLLCHLTLIVFFTWSVTLLFHLSLILVCHLFSFVT